MKHSRIRALAGAAALAGSAGCATVPPPAPPVAIARPDPRALLLTEARTAFAARAQASQLAKAIHAWHEAAGLGDSLEVRVALARAENLAALRATGEDRRTGFERGVAEARRALALAGVAPQETCPAAPKQAAPALYWLAENLDGLARELGLLHSVHERQEALCVARRAAELDEGYFHAGPLRLVGRLLARAPALQGGDAEASRKAFTRAVEIAPGFAANRVDFADTLAVKVQDVKAFAKAIEETLASDPAGAGEDSVEDELARTRARALRSQLKTLFE